MHISTLPRALSLLFAFAALSASAQTFTSSDLPIVLITTDGGADIPDEPKVLGSMAIIDNGRRQRNAVTDTPNDYDGRIGIEVRGFSSQAFPKKQYGFETRDADDEDLDVSLLGFPEEEDWILNAPYSDKSLMRNVLAYHVARATGHYASRTRFCEVVLNGQYQGVYVLLEKIKRDDNRVDINKLKEGETSGDDLTGGYIVQIDRNNDGPGSFWYSPFAPGYPTNSRVDYTYEDPDGDDLVPVQKDYIRGFITDFEALMASPGYADPQTGYASKIDVRSFVDFVIVNELSRNVDGYRLSTYLHKDKDSNDPFLHAGPVWDFNLGFGNANYSNGEQTTGLQVDYNFAADPDPVPFWWPKLYREPAFQDSLKTRWAELRRGVLRSDSLSGFIAAQAAQLNEAQARNFTRWPVLGQYVWPNAFVGDTYAEEVAYLQSGGSPTASRGWMAS